jgi:ankyrin repeat protein
MAELDTLLDAIKAGDLPLITQLIAASPGLVSARLPTGESPVMTAVYRGHERVVAALFDAGAQIDVFNAAATGRVRDLRLLLTDPVAAHSVAYDGWTPLHLAAFFGHVDAARLLLDTGADVNAVSANSLANTPLHAATAGKHTHVAMLLLDHGAKIDTIDAGNYTPLQIATQNQLETLVVRMIAASR